MGKRDFGLSSQLSDYEPPFIKPNVDEKVQRTGVAARCCTTVRRVTRNSGNAECLKIVDNTRESNSKRASPREWGEAKTQFAIMFEDRFVLA